MTIGKRYHQKIWIESITQNNMQNLNRPRQHQNTISRCLNFNTVILVEEKKKEKEGTEVLERTKDSQATGNRLNKNHMICLGCHHKKK